MDYRAFPSLIAKRAEFIEKILQGDPIAWAFAVGSVVLTIVFFLFRRSLLTNRGKKLAERLGAIKFVPWPNGRLGNEIFRIIAENNGLSYVVRARKDEAGKFKTDIVIPLIANWSFARLLENVQMTKILMSFAAVREEADCVRFEFDGIGADDESVKMIREFTEEVSRAYQGAAKPNSTPP